MLPWFQSQDFIQRAAVGTLFASELPAVKVNPSEAGKQIMFPPFAFPEAGIVQKWLLHSLHRFLQQILSGCHDLLLDLRFQFFLLGRNMFTCFSETGCLQYDKHPSDELDLV
jgi:hypothetical protein